MLLLSHLPSKSKALLLIQLTTTRLSSYSSSTPTLTPTLLKQCSCLIHTKLLHQQITVQGLLCSFTRHLVAAYIALDSTLPATLLLRTLHPSPPSVFWWNQLMRRALHHQSPLHALALYRLMKAHSWTPDHYTFPFVFKACADIPTPSFSLGASLHAAVLRSGFHSNVCVCNVAVAMYGRCGALRDARKLFDDLCRRGIQEL